MALKTQQGVSVGTTRVKLNTSPNDAVSGSTITVFPQATTPQLLIGGSAVTAANGARVPNNQAFTVTLDPGEDLYAIVGSSSLAVDVVEQGA